MVEDPTKLEWHYGKVPKVTEVAMDCLILFWGQTKFQNVDNYEYIGLMYPHGDALNPLRWYGGGPCWGFEQPEGWWAWLKKGSEPIPDWMPLTYRDATLIDVQRRIDIGEWPPEAMDRFLKEFPDEST